MVSQTQGPKFSDQLVHRYEFPNRPGFGSQGRPIELFSSYFPLSILGGLSLYRYIVEIEERDRSILSRNMRGLITSLIHEHFPQYSSAIASDEKSLLLSSQELPIGSGTYTIWCPQDMNKPIQKGQTCRVRLRAMDVITVPNTIDKAARNVTFPVKADIVQALSVILAHHSKRSSSILSVGSNKHFDIDSDRMSIGSELEVVRGLIFSVVVVGTPPRLLVNVHTTHRVFYQRRTLNWLMLKYLKEHGSKWAQLEVLLRSIKVMTTNDHSETGVTRLKSIAGFATPGDGENFLQRPVIAEFAALPRDVFFYSNKPQHQRYINVYDYFKSGKSPCWVVSVSLILMFTSPQHSFKSSKFTCDQSGTQRASSLCATWTLCNLAWSALWCRTASFD